MYTVHTSFFGYLVVNVSMKQKGVTEMLMFDLKLLGFDQLRGERQLQDWEQHVAMNAKRPEASKVFDS